MLPVNVLHAIYEHDLNRREHIRQHNVERRIMRDNSDPFSLRDELFVGFFRLNKDMVRYVCAQITPRLRENDNIIAIPIMLKLLTVLNFFATGSYQKSVGQSYNFSVSQPTVSKIIPEISVAIEEMAPQWIKFPNSFIEKREIKRRFMEASNFPGTIGAIDCTHVAIIAPSDEEHNYLNRKGFHSKNVQIICDYNLRILNINAVYAGATHDSFIWRQSAVQRELERCYNLGKNEISQLMKHVR